MLARPVSVIVEVDEPEALVTLGLFVGAILLFALAAWLFHHSKQFIIAVVGAFFIAVIAMGMLFATFGQALVEDDKVLAAAMRTSGYSSVTIVREPSFGFLAVRGGEEVTGCIDRLDSGELVQFTEAPLSECAD